MEDLRWLVKELNLYGINFNSILIFFALLILWLGKDRVAAIFKRAVSREPEITIPPGIMAGATLQKQEEILQTLRKESGGFVSEKICDLKHQQIEQRLKSGDAQFKEIKSDVEEIKLAAQDNKTNLGHVKKMVGDMQGDLKDFLKDAAGFTKKE